VCVYVRVLEMTEMFVLGYCVNGYGYKYKLRNMWKSLLDDTMYCGCACVCACVCVRDDRDVCSGAIITNAREHCLEIRVPSRVVFRKRNVKGESTKTLKVRYQLQYIVSIWNKRKRVGSRQKNDKNKTKHKIVVVGGIFFFI